MEAIKYRYQIGETAVALRRNPKLPVVIIGLSKASGNVPVYILRFQANPNDKRGFLVWEEDLQDVTQ